MSRNSSSSAQRPARLSLWQKLKLYRAVKDPVMLQKLKSRKLWVAVLATALTTLGTQLGLDADTVQNVVAIAVSYIVVEGAVDVVGVNKAK